MSHLVQDTPFRKKTANKFIAGIAAFVATGIISFSGFAGAAPMAQGNASPSEQDCKKAGFSSLILCKQAMDKEHNNGGSNGNGSGGGTASNTITDSGDSSASAHAVGYGYGGSTSVATNIDLTLNNSNDNLFHIIVNIFQ